MSENSSYRQILRSSSIIGGASVVNILVGLLRTKAAAMLLGPAGVGLIGLLQNLMTAGSTVASLGFGNAGTRQIASALGRGDIACMVTTRRALLWGAMALGGLGALIFWLLRNSLARQVFGTTQMADSVGWLALGVALGVAASSQGALLNGLRRVGDIAKISILSALLSTVIGIAALWLWGANGLLAFVLVGPIASFLISHVYVARLPKMNPPPTSVHALTRQWYELARLGTAFMLSALSVTVGQLVVRTMVQRELGTAALGQFQAAWMISMTYIGFVLSAMGTDYYPRLTTAIHDHAAVNRMVNEQTEVAILLSAPIFLAMLALAPWVVQLLYSREFSEAAEILRWQILGDVLKVASWPLGFILLATGDGRTFFLTELLTISIFAGLVWFGLPPLGVKATGVAFLGMYIVYLPMIYQIATHKTAFKWSARLRRELAWLVSTATITCLLGNWSTWCSLGTGLPAAALFGIYGLGRFSHIAKPSGFVGLFASTSKALLKRMRMWRD